MSEAVHALHEMAMDDLAALVPPGEEHRVPETVRAEVKVQRPPRKLVTHVFYCLGCGDEFHRVGPLKRGYTRYLRADAPGTIAKRHLSDEETMQIEYALHKEQTGCRTTYGPLHEFRRDGEPTPESHSWRTVLPRLGVPVPNAACEHDDVAYFGQQTNKCDVYRCNECGSLLGAEDLSPLAVQHAEAERYHMRAKVQKEMEMRLAAGGTNSNG